MGRLGDLSIPPPSGASAASGVVMRPGLYYIPSNITATGGQALVSGDLGAVPFILAAGATLDSIGVNVTSGAAGSTVRLGIYDDDTGYPGDLVLDAGTVDTATTGVKEASISQVLEVGRYWLAAVAQGGTPSIVCQTVNTGAGGMVGASSATSVIQSCFRVAGVTGALPTPFGATEISLAARAPVVMVRAA